MTIEDYLADQASRFATVAMTDTNGLLRGQMVSTGSLKGIARNGMGMSPAQLALDPTDAMLTIPGVNDDKGDFHDDPLHIDPRPFGGCPGRSRATTCSSFPTTSGRRPQICPRAILKSVIARAGQAGLVPKYGMELEYTLFDETPESARAKGYRNLKTATAHASHDLLLYQVVQTEWYEAVAAMCEPPAHRPRQDA